MVNRFMEACVAGDMDGLMNLLAEDVTAWSDSGGKVPGAARRPIQGREKVARGIMALLAHVPHGTTVEMIEANGFPALLMRIRAQTVGVITLEVEGNYIRAIRNVANPEKLAHLNLPPISEKQWRLGL